MSQGQLISPPDRFPLPPPPASRFSKTLTKEGPKWNAISNRNTPKLKFLVTRTKQTLGQFLIATFRAFAHRTTNFQSTYRPFALSLCAATLATAPFAFYGSFWRKKGESNRGTMEN